MKNFLSTVGILNDDQKMSITNVIVIIFVTIIAFKMLFDGVKVDTKLFDWTITAPNISDTLPLLFSLINYSHRRIENNKLINNQTESKTNESKP